MPRTPEHINPAEQTRIVVDSFMDFTKIALGDESHVLDVEWEHQMNRLYGNEELARVTKNATYRGVPGIKESLKLAFERGGLPGLKFVFMQQAIEHTDVASMGEAALTAFKKIIDYK